MKKTIPDSLRAKLSAAGKKGITHLSIEDRIRGGRASWKSRVRKAQEEEKGNRQ